jgi:hypothetical protein
LTSLGVIVAIVIVVDDNNNNNDLLTKKQCLDEMNIYEEMLKIIRNNNAQYNKFRKNKQPKSLPIPIPYNNAKQ